EDRRDPGRQCGVGRPRVLKEPRAERAQAASVRVVFSARGSKVRQMEQERDVAVVLSGGAVNGVLMELGFLKRLRESELWPRIGWIYGTSAGALSGTMAALDRLDELEEFMLKLQRGGEGRAPHR